MTSINYDCNVDSLHTTPIKRTGSPSEAPSTKRRVPPTSTGGRSTAGSSATHYGIHHMVARLPNK